MLVASLMLTDLARIAVITVEPAVQRFSRESDAFGSSFWRESVYVSSILTFWLFCRTSDSFYWLWGIAQPMDAPTEVTRWDGRTYRGISIALSIAFVIWWGQAPLNIWICSSSEKYARLEVCYLLEFTTFAVDHDPNASLSCTFTWKPLNFRLNCYWNKIWFRCSSWKVAFSSKRAVCFSKRLY